MGYDPETLRQWDREHVWHPFTQMQGFREEAPLIIDRGEGIYLYDLQGNRYLDGVSSLWANLHGHRRRELDQALAAQLSQAFTQHAGSPIAPRAAHFAASPTERPSTH